MEEQSPSIVREKTVEEIKKITPTKNKDPDYATMSSDPRRKDLEEQRTIEDNHIED